jgi:hypothetical protein
MSTKTRALRRHQAFTHAKQRQALHLARTHPNQEPGCLCERSPLYFSKRRAFGCNCRKRRQGAPRTGTGDKADARDAIYLQRRAGREVLGAILSGQYEADEQAISRAFHLVLF